MLIVVFGLALERTAAKSEYCGEYFLDPAVILYIMSKQEIWAKFDFKRMKFNQNTSRLYFTKHFDDPKDVTEFKKKFTEYLHSFIKEEVKIPKSVFDKVREVVEGKRSEFEAEEVDLSFEGLLVTLVGTRKDVVHKKQQVETMVDKLTEEAQTKSTKIQIEDKNRLKFLNFIDYFDKLNIELPKVQIDGADSISGNLTLLETACSNKVKNVQQKIF